MHLYLGLSNHFEKKKVSHNDMTSYCHQHIVCNYGGGKKLKVHSPLSWQQLFIYFVLCLCLFLFLFIFTKGLKSLPRSTSSVTDIKMRVSSPLLSASHSIVLSLPFFFFSSLFHWVQKRREKRVVFYLNNCHQSRLFDGGARIIRGWSWVPARQQVKQLTRHREGWHTVSDIRLGTPRCVCKNN